MTYTPVSASITEVLWPKNQRVLGHREVSNLSNVTTTFSTDLHSGPGSGGPRFVFDTINSAWNPWFDTNAPEVDGEDGGVVYNVKVLADRDVGRIFYRAFGDPKPMSYQTTVHASKLLRLPPNESVTAQLSSRCGILKARVVYEASLGGMIACNYNPSYAAPGFTEGHHFYQYSVNDLMGTIAPSLPSRLPVLQPLPSTSYSTFSPQHSSALNPQLATTSPQPSKLSRTSRCPSTRTPAL